MKQSIDKTSYTRSGSQRGLSLIELMISITIGLIILVSLSTLFINQSRTRAELDKSNRMIDNGRYAMDVLSSNLKLAGYYDSYVPPKGLPTISSLPDPCDTAALINPTSNPDILLLHVQGYNATTSVVPSPAFNTVAPKCAAILTANSVTLKPGSDILVIRRASTQILQGSPGNGIPYLQVSNCGTDSPPLYLLATTSTATFPLLKAKCALTADLRPFLVQVYFVSPDKNPAGNFTGTRPTWCTGDCIPTLNRLEFDPNGNFMITPLVEGIEFMQIDYGVDTNGDGAADSYTDCSAATTASTCVTVVTGTQPIWSNVVSVKINLLARNLAITQGWNETKTYNLGIDGSVGPFNDSYKRHVYTQLVRLNNPAGRKELPCATTPCR